MDLISKLPAWLGAIALAAIAFAFAYIVIVKPERFEFAGLGFGSAPKANMTLDGAVIAFDHARTATTKECPDGWDLFEPAMGRMILGAGVTTNTLPPSNERALKPSWSESKDKSVGGEVEHELTEVEMPAHDHGGKTANSSEQSRGIGDDGPEVLLKSQVVTDRIQGASFLRLPNRGHVHVIQRSGNSKPHNNMPPHVALYFCKRSVKSEADE